MSKSDGGARVCKAQRRRLRFDGFKGAGRPLFMGSGRTPWRAGQGRPRRRVLHSDSGSSPSRA